MNDQTGSPMRPLFEGQVVLVTGASGGIGSAIARAFLESGALVAGTWNTSRERVAQLAASYGADRFLAVQLDLQSAMSISLVFETVCAKFGVPVVLVNAAGKSRARPFVSLSSEEMERLLDVNLHGHMAMTSLVARSMVQRGTGAIVTISSKAGQVGLAGDCVYATAKGGLIAFTRSLAMELAHHGIRVNAVAPGFVGDGIAGRYPEEIRARMAARSALGRLARPEEIAEVVLFLASGRSSYVNGETVAVDGGWM